MIKGNPEIQKMLSRRIANAIPEGEYEAIDIEAALFSVLIAFSILKYENNFDKDTSLRMALVDCLRMIDATEQGAAEFREMGVSYAQLVDSMKGPKS